MPQTPTQVIVNTALDPGLSQITARDNNNIIANNNVLVTKTDKATITNTVQNVTQIITTTIVEAAPAGANNSIQVNEGNAFTSFGNLTYDPTTDTLTSDNSTFNNITTNNITTGNINVTGNTHLGSVTNITITGGNNTQFLTTDGTGNLSWANTLPSLTNNNGKFLTVSNNAVSWGQVSYLSLSYRPIFANIATSASYNDLVDVPTNVTQYVSVPTSSQGQAGDKPGMWAQDSNYFYYCTATFVGNLAAIWRRVANDTNLVW
jgi:hypothetical protein